MAPYALTPTLERGELPGGSWSTLPQTARPSTGEITPRTNGHGSQHINGNNGHPVMPHEAESPTGGSINGVNTPKSTSSYEDAYVHGYKEGYSSGFTKAHIELKHQPIAIIGMSCRLPGSVSTPDEFWELLARSRTGFSPIPTSRFSANRFHHANPGKSGATNARGGNFLTHDLRAFDAPFFGFTQQEATSLDPQQRLLLECTFEALESAGVPKHEVVGKDVGVFVGGTFSEYEADLFRDPDTIPMHQATGCAMAMQSNRISHFFDFRGPSFTVDTACSSSLVALHAACQSIRTGESSMALAAGVHLNMLPEFWISYSMSRLFGEDGRSYAFDQRGTGYGRGEGCGIVLLKTLDQAIKDNDPIRAVITGSGINQDGKTNGITLPNGAAQEALIRSVYSDGGMDPTDTGYVEAHGTGTRIGDPIEVTALHSVFGEGRNKRRPLYIGSVKSNIGHLEAAAGIAGIIKTALMLERGFILPNYDFKQPNEKIPFDEWGIKVPIRQQPWPLGKKWASVNGFGFGGTNAHVVMTRGPLERKTMKEEIDTQTQDRLFILSANDKNTTEQAMKNLGIYLEQRPEVFQNDLLSNLAYTLGQRKSIHPWRIAITASSAVSLVESLSSGKILPAKQELEVLRLGWVFTGQGAQWWAMGRELYQQYPVYAASLDKASSCLSFVGAGFSLLDELQKDEQTTQINAAHISQPACTAVQLALVDLLRSWKVTPTAVVGHSSGEIAAAYSADIITFEDAMTIAYHRGRLIPILKEKYPALSGSMMAVGTGAAEVAPLLERIPSHLGEARIACINSPSSVTVSGDSDAVTEVQRLIEEKYPGMFARRLAVDTAYHSHHMNLVAKEYTDSLRQLAPPRPSTISFHSSLLGRSASYVDLDATYWVQNLTCAVRFDQAVQDMCGPVGDLKTSVNFLVELGPHAALQGPLKQILKHIGATANKIGYSSVLSRKKDAVQTALALAGTLFVKGSLLDMGEINFPKPPERLPQVLTDMPRYAWNHSTSYYHESRLTKIHKYHDGRRHDLLGVLAPYSDSIEPTWRNILRLDDVPWLRHHQMQGVTIFPISGFAVMAIEAMAQQAQSKNMQYEALQVVDLTVKVPAMLTEEDLEMTTTLRSCSESSDGTKFDFHIRSWSESKGWTENCTGSVLACLSTSHVNAVDGNRIKKHKESRLEKRISQAKLLAKEPISAEDMYKRLSEIGVSYGTNLQGIDECFASPDTSHAQLRLSDTIAEMPEHQESEYVLHPTLLEQLITMYWPILYAKGPLNTVHLPSTIGTITVSSKASTYIREKLGMQAFCEPTSKLSNSRPNKLSMVATTDTSEQLIAIENLSITPILETSMDTEAEGARELCFRLDWEPIIMPDDSESPSTCQSQFDADIVIIHGDSESQLQLASTLSDRLLALTGTIPAAGTLDAMADVASDKLCIIVPELDQPILANMDVAKFEALQRLLTTVRGALWVVRGAYTNPAHPDTNMITGLSRTLRSEGTLMNFITLDLDCAKDDEAARQVSTILHVLTRTLSTARNTEETEFAERHGQLMTPRIVNDDSLNEFVDKQVHPPATEPASFLDIQRPLQGRLQTPHVLDSLTFEDLKPSELCEDEVEIQVKAIGLSSRDIEADSAIGLECSGVVTAVGSNVPNFHAGDRVAGFTPNGSLSTITRAQHPFLFKLPHHTSFESAAAIPLAYCTASYALRDQAQLREGETILVHDGATPVGQAAISISQTLGADVWTTVKNTAEKALLMQHFCIVEDRILYALSEDFAETIEESTGGRGVDVIFDSLTEPRLDGATCRSLADFGQHIKVGAHKSQERTPLKANTTMLSIDIIALGKHRPRVIQRSLADVARMLNYGMIQPVQDIKTYGISQMATALHDVHASGPNSSVVVIPQTDDLVMAPRIEKHISLLRDDATYILIGGTGGLGRSMAKWMISKRAKNIVLLSRSGELHGKAKEQIDNLNQGGANIVVRRCDVADRASVDQLLSSLSDLPPVRGIVHGAMVLHDVLFEKMTHHQYSSVVASKVHGAWNFYHALTAARASLDFFVVISSAAGAVGNRGQAAYAAANTFLNGFAQHLIAQGIRAASLDLTAVSDAGYLAEDAEKAAEVARNLGSDTICEAEVLALLHAAIEGKLSSCNGHPITGMRITSTMRPFWSNDAKFVHLLRVAEEASNLSSSATAKVSWSAAFKAASSRAEAEQVVCSALVEKIAEVISMEPEELDTGRALSHYPLDSLTAIEVRNFITRMFEASLQVLELLASGSIESLAKVICTKTKASLPEA